MSRTTSPSAFLKPPGARRELGTVEVHILFRGRIRSTRKPLAEDTSSHPKLYEYSGPHPPIELAAIAEDTWASFGQDITPLAQELVDLNTCRFAILLYLVMLGPFFVIGVLDRFIDDGGQEDAMTLIMGMIVVCVSPMLALGVWLIYRRNLAKMERVRAALEGYKPFMRSHGFDVELQTRRPDVSGHVVIACFRKLTSDGTVVQHSKAELAPTTCCDEYIQMV